MLLPKPWFAKGDVRLIMLLLGTEFEFQRCITLREQIDNLGLGTVLNVCCDNGHQQQVVGGELTAVKTLVNHLARHGVNTIKLGVNGAWHTPLMHHGVAQMRQALADLPFSAPVCPLIMNSSGKAEYSVAQIKENLALHLIHTVRWRESMDRWAQVGHRRYLEISNKKLIWLCGPDWHYPLIVLLGVLVLPALMVVQLGKSTPFNILLALKSYSEPESYRPRQRRLPRLVAEDLLLNLLTNFALVLPIARKPAFSLAPGYADPAFIVAFMILMGAVTLFMLAFASRTRRYVLFGELLNGTLDVNSAPAAPWAFTGKLTRWQRGLLWLLASQLWAIAICLVFAALQITPQFIPLYLSALLPLLVVYCAERYQTLYDNYNEALEMHKRHQVYVNNDAKTMK